ncbi:H(+)/Cl(-) exchange transporter 7-like [Paramacrobiotus metropolitanus]|uniref:H(+)/Cl(-) exchange transporter 7-like n=1 Tax=Paramacrobiotus metropolitanus TaxID=2943436 RepID=UPI0024456D9B|nr:H(+)/Cl(-) exchange transporter 7-like [Paramacrobiotus metropolitanus]XP_055338310.1 H(+)/Cl(-) exchange transporter 7-like [Paramacrobiotus metropolitanus]
MASSSHDLAESEPLLCPQSRRESHRNIWYQSPYIGGQLDALERTGSVSDFSTLRQLFDQDDANSEGMRSVRSNSTGSQDGHLNRMRASVRASALPAAGEFSYIRNRYAPLREKSSTRVISDQYESLDYDKCENSLYLRAEAKQTFSHVNRIQVEKWIVMFFIGTFVALIANAVVITVEKISEWKYSRLRDIFDVCSTTKENCLVQPLGFWILSNMVPVLLGSALTVYVAPAASGSGVAQVKCFLNGVKIPEFVRIKTLIVKILGMIGSLTGGLAVGKEGPMIHIGAIVGAGVSQGRSTTFKKDAHILEEFRSDTEKRDFVSAGVAAGIGAAFGAPVGGVLLSLEEGASFWNQSLTWKVFFCSLVSVFVYNLIIGVYDGHPGDLSNSGLINLGEMMNLKYLAYEIPIYLLMAVGGGLLGAIFNFLNFHLTMFRHKHITRKWARVSEVVLISAVTATVGFMLIYFIDDCQMVKDTSPQRTVQMLCPDGEYSSIATMLFQTSEFSVRNLLHDEPGTYRPTTLVAFLIVYFLLACWTCGSWIPSGNLIPGLLIGATWGRLCGIGMMKLVPGVPIDPGKYALIGAAAQLGGITRMTISLTVILIETTGNITFGLPIMITLIVAQWVGNWFNDGLFDIHVKLLRVPLLDWEPPPLSSHMTARSIMSYPVYTFKTVEKVGVIYDILKKVTHNGFPVVEEGDIRNPLSDEPETFGRFRGLILRSQLITLLQNRVFNESPNISEIRRRLDIRAFRDDYPRYPSIKDVIITEAEKNFTMNLYPYMNPSPYVAYLSTPFPRVFRLFRALGLRHIAVVDTRNQVVGIVTRKDLARYRVETHKGRIKVEELQVSNELAVNPITRACP